MTEPQLNTTQLNQLQNFIAVDFEAHKQQYFAAKVGGQSTYAEQFYSFLSSNGFSYGDRALGVVRNDTLSGKIANLNSNNISLAKSGVDISYESDNALRIQYELMVGHRTRMIERDGRDLTYEQQLDNHEEAYATVGAPSEAFTMHTPLTQIAESDPTAAQELWGEVIVRDNGFMDGVLTEGFGTGSYIFSSLASQNNSLIELGSDAVEQVEWIYNVLDTAHTLGGAELIDFYEDYVSDPLQDTLNDLDAYWDRTFGFQVDDSSNITDYDFLNNNNFANTFSSLGYSTSYVNNFLNNGWASFGTGNSGYDDLGYNFGGGNFTAFASNNTINMSVAPNGNEPLWSTPPQIGGYSLDPYIAGINGRFGKLENRVSPLSFDLDGDGIETTGIYDTDVFFDIDGDGYAEKVGWIGPDDGQLALDVNGNGIIDDITELFGDDIMPAYQKLALHDSNGDGIISSLDDVYGDLLVWRDLDQDGLSDDGELFALTDASIQIKEISLAEQVLDQYQNENYISGSSSFTRYDNTVGTMYDVHFLNDNVNTWFLGARSEQFGSTYEVSPEALLLPLSRGYGSLASLHIAMTDNMALRDIMKEVVNLAPTDFDQLSGKMEAFLYEWAGVTDNDPDARKTGNGSNIDARKVDFLEEFTGVEWAQMGVTELVGSKASVGVKKIWTEIENLMTVRVLVQGTLHDEVFENATYDFVTDELTLGDDMTTLIARAQTYITGAASSVEHQFWLSMGNVLIMHMDELGMTHQQISDALDTAYGADLFIGEQVITAADGDIYSAIDGSDETLSTNTFVGTSGDDVITGSNGNDYMFGLDGADTMYGLGGDDFLRGDGGGDLHLDGGDGDDRIEGDDGDDTLIGGDGRDDLRGGDGIDTLNGGDGQDKLHGGAGADVIDGGVGLDEIDYLESDAAVYVNLKTRVADGGHATGDTFVNIENVTGSDFSDVLIGDARDNNLVGESGNDFIYGGKGDDDLFGGHGNDQMFGEDGDDMFDGFDGTELMDGGNGTDTVNYIHPYNTSGVHADLSAGMGYAGAASGDTYVSIENLIGSVHGDILVGDDGNNVLEGREGNDILIGAGGDDVLLGGEGINALVGGSGNDRFIITPHQVGIVTVHDFNPAEDVLDYRFFTTEITTSTDIQVAAVGADTLVGIDDTHFVLLKDIQPAQLFFSNFEVDTANSTLNSITVYTNVDTGTAMPGDQYGNKLLGTLHADTIDGLDGDDIIWGFEGNDVLSGGDGNDVLQGGDGADDMDGGNHIDTVDYGDSYEGVTVNLTTGTGVGGTAEGDTLSNIEAIDGSSFDDVLIGNSNNVLNGGAGNDILHAKGGQNNVLIGDQGDDTFIIDQVSGATLPDTGLSVVDDNFIAVGGTPTSITYITDFESGNTQETIDLSNITLTDMYVSRIDNYVFNGETISGVALQLFNGTENQTVLLKDAAYDLLTEDNFILPGSVSFGNIHWQVIGNNSNQLLVGSEYDDVLFGLGGNDFFLGGPGNDTIYSNSNYIDTFHISKNANDTETIYNFLEYYRAVQWFPGVPSGTHSLGGENAPNLVAPGDLSFAATNGIFDLSSFANIRGFSDLSVTASGNDTLINLTDGQQIVLKGFKEGLYSYPNFPVNFGTYGFQGTFNEPYSGGPYGIVGNGVLYDTLQVEIDEDNFIFYDGTLNGDQIIGSVDDILEGGYGVDHIFGLTGNDTITGAADNDTLEGGSGNDVLDGEDGDDTLIGGDDGDTFIIGKEINATDTISDFEYWRTDEQIDLSAFDADFTDFASMSQNITQQGNDTHIDLGDGQTLILSNFTADNLVAANIIGNAGFNTNPIAIEDTLFGLKNQNIAGNLLADNGAGIDSDADNDALSVINGTFFSTFGGSVVLSANGDFTYTPDVDFSGVDTFVYTLTDPYGGTSSAAVTLNVSGVNTDPVTQADVLNTAKNVPIVIAATDLLGNDYDAESHPLVIDSVVSGTDGTAVLNGDGTITFTPDSSFSGVAFFTYVAADGQGGLSDSTMVAISINNVSSIINGTSAAETLEGTSGADHMFGFEQNDTLNGRAGDDVLDGGDGDDFLDAGNGDDFLFGGAGNDTLQAWKGLDVLSGDAGEDILYGHDDKDYLFGGDDDDEMRGEGNDDVMYGGYGNDEMYGGHGNDIIYGELGDDIILGWAGADLIYGGLGNDTINGEDNSDTIYGGDGNDIIDGGGQDDILYGEDGDDILNGGNGDDTFFGGAGNDTMIGWTDDDTFDGGLGSDTITTQAGNDRINFYSATAFTGVDTITDLNVSFDWIDIRDLLGGYNAYTDDINDFVRITNDGMDSTLAIDTDGGADGFVDIAIFEGVTTLDDLDWTIANKVLLVDDLTVFGGGGQDETIDGTAYADRIYGLDGEDTLNAGGGHDLVYGGNDNDVLNGAAGDDILYGEDGDDTINGGNGNDILFGGNGADILDSDQGYDTYLFTSDTAFNGIDTLTNMNINADSIDISDVLAGYDPLNDAITDFVEITDNGTGGSILKVDIDGTANGVNFVQIATIDNLTGLTDEAQLVTNGTLVV